MKDESTIPNQQIPINKQSALLLVLLLVFTAFTGYAFGADAGYLKGRQDCSLQPINSQPIQMP